MSQVCSVLSQLLQLFSRVKFARAVKQHGAERNTKGFTCWSQFLCPCCFANAESLFFEE